MMMISFDAGYRMNTPYASQMMSYNNAPVDDNADYMNNNATSYSRSSSSSTSSGNINGVPYSYSSGTENGVPFGYGSGNNNSYNAGYGSEGGNTSPFNSFSNLFGSGGQMGGGQSGILQGAINNSGPVFAPVFGNGNTTYARSGDAYSNQQASAYNSAPPPPPAMYENNGGYQQAAYTNYASKPKAYCPPYIPMDYQEQPPVSYAPTNHYQQDYNCYKPTPLNFPTMPTYGYTPNPGIPCPPEMAAAPRMPNYPTPMNMPSLGRQITPFGHPEAANYPPAPHFPELRGPSEAPKAPTFYCPPAPPRCDNFPPARPQQNSY
jgi:hypothetical protein